MGKPNAKKGGGARKKKKEEEMAADISFLGQITPNTWVIQPAGEVIGEGAYGKVLPIKTREEPNLKGLVGKTVEVKEEEGDRKKWSVAEREARIHSWLFLDDHSADPGHGQNHIIQIKDFGFLFHGMTLETVVLVLEKATSGDLIDLLNNEDADAQNDPVLILSVAGQMSGALMFLKERKVAHRDLNTGNVLICRPPTKEQDGVFKMSDFGCASHVPQGGLVGAIGNIWIQSPEMRAGEKYTEATDWWSLGVVLGFMTDLWPQFEKEDEERDQPLLTTVEGHDWELERVAEGAEREALKEEMEEIRRLILGLIHPEPTFRSVGQSVVDLVRLQREVRRLKRERSGV